ncbi:MAG: amino acid adenylation domain-containing protein [Saprospiraceae bacterium]|nr:amino acid adenylation domain-containing protein [Saprospiraceae bacterium]
MVYLLQHALEQSADKYPDKDAFRCMSQRLTYGELERQTNNLARALQNEGLQKGDRVGILLNRCIDTPVALYGVLKAGGVAVPIDPFAPVERIRFVIADCGIGLLISNNQQRRALQKLDLASTQVRAVMGPDVSLSVPNVSWSLVASNGGSPTANTMLEHDLAYIMYTSGTTGTPKGIMHTHHSGLAYARLSGNLYGVNANDVVANHSPLHFDISTFGYFTAPLFGATTIICSDAETKIPNSLAQLIDKEGITIWYSVPLALTQMLQGGMIHELSWSSLRWILYGGEPFPVSQLKILLAKTRNARWSNVYGPAEVNQCTYYHFDASTDLASTIPLGHIWGNTDMLIVDENDNSLGINEQGELLIRSSTMMSGYWNQPARNDKAFLSKENAPFEQRYYRTGDLVTLDSDGLLHFEGRKDRQVKIRGYRIELDEVQSILDLHEALDEVAVFVHREGQDKSLAAAVVTALPHEEVKRTIRLFVASKLPSYCIPEKVIILTNIPRTAAGKVDHRALVKLTEE